MFYLRRIEETGNGVPYEVHLFHPVPHGQYFIICYVFNECSDVNDETIARRRNVPVFILVEHL